MLNRSRLRQRDGKTSLNAPRGGLTAKLETIVSQTLDTLEERARAVIQQKNNEMKNQKRA